MAKEKCKAIEVKSAGTVFGLVRFIRRWARAFLLGLADCGH
jgi:hypothetical protein